jgi:hypothetical protein
VEEHPPGAGRIVQPSEQTLPESENEQKVEKCEEKPDNVKAEDNE